MTDEEIAALLALHRETKIALLSLGWGAGPRAAKAALAQCARLDAFEAAYLRPVVIDAECESVVMP